MPGESVGVFRIGEIADALIASLGLRKLEPDVPGAYWDTYEIPGMESRVMVEDVESPAFYA